MRSLAFLAIIFLSIQAYAEEPETYTTEDVRVTTRALKLRDEVTYTPQSIAIEHPASDVYLGETLAKLPGVLVRNTSGFGSLTTIITSQALGSGGTRISIDDIPIVDPTGLGVNLSLVPNTLIGSVEQRTAFFPSVDPIAETLPSPSGWMNFKTLSPPKEGERRYGGGLLLGTGNTIQGTASYRGGNESQDWIGGLSGFNTQGNFHFVNPLTGLSEERANNDAAGGGALGKYHWHFKEQGSVEILDLFSHSDRTNPGDIRFPTRDHEKDTFNLLGVRYSDPQAISKHDGLFAKTAGSLSRTATRSGPGATSTDSRTLGQYTQAGYVRRADSTSVTLALDNLHDFLRSDLGAFNRNTFGATASVAFDFGKFRVVPLGRQEASSTFAAARDGSLTLMYFADSNDDLSLSYGLLHLYPSITASTGYSTSGSTVLPNPSLNVQRDSIVSFSFNRRNPRYTFYTGAFYDLIRNRTTYSSISPNLSQFVNTAEVSVWGYTIDGQIFPLDGVSLRASLSLTRAWDRSSGHEMPYKPRAQGFLSATYLIQKWIGVTAEERFVGKRYISVSSIETMSPYAQTDLRLDVNVLGGTAFFKAANIADQAGFENPGFPIAGRSYWVGYTL